MLYIFYTQFNGNGTKKGEIMFILDILMFALCLMCMIAVSAVILMFAFSDGVRFRVEKVDGTYRISEIIFD